VAVFSLNAPVPSSVAALAGDLAMALPQARRRPRGSHTLVVKRLDEADGPDAAARVEARLREVLAGTAPCAARVDAVEVVEAVPTGTAPVVYLAVESPGLVALHERLAEAFEPVPDLEGDGYVPHVTIARGGTVAAARELAARDVDPIEWTVDDLVCWDAEREHATTRFSLPA
jgi:2'-5' RNA ligase